jgi:hypothetical protein
MKEFDHIFAVGDCCISPYSELKLGYIAEFIMHDVINNIVNLSKKKKLNK